MNITAMILISKMVIPLFLIIIIVVLIINS